MRLSAPIACTCAIHLRTTHPPFPVAVTAHTHRIKNKAVGAFTIALDFVIEVSGHASVDGSALWTVLWWNPYGCVPLPGCDCWLSGMLYILIATAHNGAIPF